MSENSIIITTIPLGKTKNGFITIARIDEPYGKNSKPVISIGTSLKGNVNSPDWKVHIPVENLDEIIKSLQNIQKQL